MRRRLAAVLGLLAALLALSLPAGVAARDFGRGGSVYTMTNAATGNAVLAYARAADGSLSLSGTFPTGGSGTGSGLGSQGAVTLSADGQWLAAVDAGSNDVALFSVNPDGSLRLADRVVSGGSDPISVTLHGPFLYVLDAGGNGNIAGFVRILRAPGRAARLDPAAQPCRDCHDRDLARGNRLQLRRQRAGRDGEGRRPPRHLPGRLLRHRRCAEPYASAGAAPYGFAFDGRTGCSSRRRPEARCPPTASRPRAYRA